MADISAMAKQQSHLPIKKDEQEPVESFRRKPQTQDNREKQNHWSCGKLLDRVFMGTNVHYKHPKKPMITLCGHMHPANAPSTRFVPPGADYSDLDLDHVTCKSCLQVRSMRGIARQQAIAAWKRRKGN